MNLHGTRISKSGTSSLGSDRLRKAIERNRRKQGKKSTRERGDMARLTERTMRSANSKGTRLSVGRPGESEFLGQRKKPASPSKINYSVKKKARPKRKTHSKTGKKFVLNDRVATVLWLFVGFLAFRLLFADRGVIDYYSKKSRLEQKEKESLDIETSNANLAKEMTKIKSESSYQKKLIREHLGYIAENEFLILFEEVKTAQSI